MIGVGYPAVAWAIDDLFMVVRLFLGLVMLAAGALGLVDLQHRGDDIRARHTAVNAYVVGQKGHRHWKVLQVEYVYRARLYRTDLLDIGWGLSPGAGEQMSLAIDPDRPAAAAGPGLVSGSAWRYWYQPVGFVGIVVIVTALWGWRRRPVQAAGSLDVPVLDHPEPAWADRADGTVRTLVLFPGSAAPPRREDLVVRRIDPETAEICCVPFLQTRMALGDVVRVDARAYAVEVTVPSGRVTFAVRGAGSRIAGLIGEFPATVVEPVGTGLFAVAAGSAGEAGAIHARLREWERDGHVAYRSFLRHDQEDTPLL